MLLGKRFLRAPRSNARCQVCHDLRLHSAGTKDGFLDILLEDLPRSSIERGCLVCRVLYESIIALMADWKPPNNFEDEKLLGVTLHSKSKSKADCNGDMASSSPLAARLKTENMTVAELEIYTYPGKPVVWPLIGPARDISLSASSERCTALAAEWLRECTELHSKCRLQSSTPLPDRVIHVGNDHREPYLYVNHGRESGRYAALSHCWGGMVKLRTERDTLEAHTQEICYDALPKTFQDAVIVCRLLGIDFLWIDSLCIIQDSTEDWAIQSSKMDAVYSNSYVTVAADAAANSESGFIVGQRENVKVKRFDFPGADGQDSVVCVRKKGCGDRDTFNHHCWLAPDRSPLSGRGWVLQESVLSPRILHFTLEELTWECITKSYCECTPDPHEFSTPPLRLRIDDSPFHARWRQLVEDFTDRALTFQADRLFAISGLASRMQKSTDAQYWAGLWSDHFPLCLLWRVLGHHQDASVRRCISKRQDQYQAPTWSWASITGRVILHGSERFTSHLTQVDVVLVPAGPNLYGPVSNASLTIEGLVAPTQVEKRPVWGDRAEFYAFCEEAVDGAQPSGEVIPDVQGDHGYEIRVGETHLVLVVADVPPLVHCLLLRRARTEPGSYERVGLLDTRCDFNTWKAVAKLRQVKII